MVQKNNGDAGDRQGQDVRGSERTHKRRLISPFGDRHTRGRWGHVYAALDLGTNNCRLLIAKPVRDRFHVIDAFSRMVRLGEGVEQTGYLSQDAMDRAVEALKVCASKIRWRKVTRIRAIATEACRMAGNGDEFIARVKRETGISLDIILSDEEAHLAVTGCSSLLDRSYDGALIFDIGGGSTELVWLDLARSRKGNGWRVDAKGITAWTSLPFGVVNLTERHGGGDVPADVYEAMVLEVIDQLEGFDEAEELRPAFEAGRAHMLAASGTVTTLAGIHLGLLRYDRDKVDGTWIDIKTLHAIARRISSMSYKERAAVPCIGYDRAGLVVAGCAILEAINRLWPCQRLRVADRGLREGMLLALMDKADRDYSRRRRRSRKRNQAPVDADNPKDLTGS